MSSETINLEITGMTCGNCAATIKKFLGTLPGINADVSFENSEAVIEISDETTIETIIKTVEMAGFKAVQRWVNK